MSIEGFAYGYVFVQMVLIKFMLPVAMLAWWVRKQGFSVAALVRQDGWTAAAG